MSLSMSVPDRMANRKAISEYQNYRRLISQMGKSETVSLTAESFKEISKGNLEPYDNGDFSVVGLHPVFLLLEHFSSADGDYYERGSFLNLGTRGDSVIIPAYSEIDAEVYFLSTSFHKGDCQFAITYFPNRPEKVNDDLLKILYMYETR